MKIVVVGTGLIGSILVSRLTEHRHDAVAASRASGVDTLTGDGLAQVLEGATVVVDLSSPPSFEAQPALDFLETSTRNLLAAEAAAGVGHHVALSVVGAGRLTDSGYFQGKCAQEKLIGTSSIAHTIVHATQSFEFLWTIADDATVGNIVRFGPVHIQPISSYDVATALGMVATGMPVDRNLEVCGPDRFRLDELVRVAMAARDDPREVVTDPGARYFGAQLSQGTLMPGEDAMVFGTRFGSFPAPQAFS